jgi:hypothetical protein
MGLLNKLENIGIQESLLLWIKNYLADRKQRVVIESAHSKWRTIKAGNFCDNVIYKYYKK